VTRAEFVAEMAGILLLLRDHAFLAYSPSGRREYEQKLRTCADQFAYLVFRKTDLPVRALPGLVQIEALREASYAAGISLARRAAKKATAIAAGAAGLNRDYYGSCARLWKRAADRLAAPESKNKP
jgi:hypothetical protein